MGTRINLPDGNDHSMRLDKFVAEGTGLSRALVKKLLHQKRVTVNHESVRDGARQIHVNDQIRLDDREIGARKPRYYMLHKPPGYICASDDGNHPTVMDLLGEEQIDGLHIAGRLDKDTTGLVLITDDGQWSHRVTAPGRHVGKCYRVLLAEPISPESIAQIQQGILLRGEDKPTRPAEVTLHAPAELDIVIHEGRYHQVKRMFGALGNRVIGLHRSRIGALELDRELPTGCYRALQPDEIELF